MTIVARYQLILSLFSFCSLTHLFSQETHIVEEGCQFITTKFSGPYTFGRPSEEMRQIHQDILKAGQSENVQILLRSAPEASNAFATVINNKRYIIYNESFVEQFNTNSLTSWSARFLLAHEIGHHVFNHSFSNNSKEQNHQNELEADQYATEVLVALGADLDETFAGLSTLTDVYAEESFTHPAPTVRIINIRKIWREAMAKQNFFTQDLSLSTKMLANKAALRLDERSFNNPWTIISEAKGEIDGEKIIISFNLQDQLNQNKSYKVCLLSNNPDINPGKNEGSIFDPTISTQIMTGGTTQKLIWNYRMDRYTRNQVEKDGDLRFYVFDKAFLPQEPSPSAILGGTILTSLGTGAIVWGVIEFFEGKDLYNNTYLITRRDEDYEAADARYVRGQYLMAGGIMTGAIGYHFLSRYSKRLRYFRNSVCSSERSPKLQFGSNELALVWMF